MSQNSCLFRSTRISKFFCNVIFARKINFGVFLDKQCAVVWFSLKNLNNDDNKQVHMCQNSNQKVRPNLQCYMYIKTDLIIPVLRK